MYMYMHVHYVYIASLFSLTATFDGYIPWTADVHTYSIDDFLQVRESYIHVHVHVYIYIDVFNGCEFYIYLYMYCVCCVALPCCLFDFACFVYPSFSSLIKTCTCT